MSHTPATHPRTLASRLLIAVVLGGLLATVGATATAAPAAAATKYVYLSFDDGPHPRYTAQVLDILSRYQVRATFFEIGQNVARYPSLTRRAHLRGHSVQNHTWSHPDLRTVSAATFRSQVLRTDGVIRAQTGYTPRCLRPPYGAVNSTVRSRTAALGKKIRLWTIDPRDWARPGSSVIARRVLDNVRPGSIILLHDGGGDRSQTVAALPTILRTLKAQGYVFYRMWCR
jgi:peptidoglycan/xylan/chitin deacetylase (PgdA/CDA1 family)